MAKQTQRFATYKGRTYRLEFLGKTKFGERARLAFLDGSKEFWVAADLISETSAAPQVGPRRRSGRGECYECGAWGPSGESCPECGGEGSYS